MREIEISAQRHRNYSLFTFQSSLFTAAPGPPRPAWAELMRRQMRSKPEIAEALDERAMPRVGGEAASEGYVDSSDANDRIDDVLADEKKKIAD